MKIESYGFGRIVIGGKTYRSDVIVFHDRVHPEWWRKMGHRLHAEDLDEILAAGPSTLIVGCGAAGLLRIPEETKRLLRERNISLVALRTGPACKEYNSYADDQSVVGAFHLTC